MSSIYISTFISWHVQLLSSGAARVLTESQATWNLICKKLCACRPRYEICSFGEFNMDPLHISCYNNDQLRSWLLSETCRYAMLEMFRLLLKHLIPCHQRVPGHRVTLPIQLHSVRWFCLPHRISCRHSETEHNTGLVKELNTLLLRKIKNN